jgi:phosphoribosyl 1,2-cyclic phosphodiesterase
MRLWFLGTRGEIEARSRLHQRHSSLLISHRHDRVLLDCGLDWLGELERLRPPAVLVTHGHPDHVGGLKHGAPCPVYATEATWRLIGRWPIAERRTLRPHTTYAVGAIAFQAVPVEHSLRAPAVAFRVTAGATTVLYAPDVVAIPGHERELARVSLYVGDGASPVRPIIRRRDGAEIGHASIRTQLDWCAEAGLRRAIFTHCGSQVLRAEAATAELVEAMGRDRGVSASLAYDGLELPVPLTRRARQA